jgi:hypothetical protein
MPATVRLPERPVLVQQLHKILHTATTSDG